MDTSEIPEPLPGRIPESIMHVARVLRGGGVVVVPTDTVYGLAASVFRPEAVERVFAIKRRSHEKRVPVLLASAADLPVLVRGISRSAWKLIDRFWPGPLTLILPAARHAPQCVTPGDTIAIRVPANRVCLELLNVLGEPIVGTSANRSGQTAVSSITDARSQLGGEVDAYLEDDRTGDGLAPSTVLEVGENSARIHRLGAVTVEAIRETLGSTVQIHH